MMKLLLKLLPFIVFLGSLIINLIVGRLGDAYHKGYLDFWYPLGSPPDKVVRIEDISIDTNRRIVVYVSTVTNKIFSCKQSNNMCWIESNLPAQRRVNDFPKTCTTESSYYQRPGFVTLEPPSGVLERRSTSICYGEEFGEVNYVLLEDGSVWMLEHKQDTYANAILISISQLPVIMISGTVVAIGLYLTLKSGKKQIEAHA